MEKNTPLVTHIYTADPSAHNFEGKIYIYPSHDLEHECEDNDNGDQYNMEDYHILCMDDVDGECKDLGEVLHKNDVPWVSKQMWAPDCAFKNGKYYLYFPARDKEGLFRIGVATSNAPGGPFKPESDYIKGSFSIDPCVFVDDDGQGYLYFGGLWGGQLEKWQTGRFLPEETGPKGDEAALGPQCARLSDDMLSFKSQPKQIVILDENGEPLKAADEDRRYFEGPWLHKYKDTYYLSYSTGTTCTIVYATAKNPEGPFTFRGKILEPVIGWTTHHSIMEHNGKWYLFYHDSSWSRGVSSMRCVKYTELEYLEDGSIKTINPYAN